MKELMLNEWEGYDSLCADLLSDVPRMADIPAGDFFEWANDNNITYKLGHTMPVRNKSYGSYEVDITDPAHAAMVKLRWF